MKLDQDTRIWVFAILVVLFVGFGRQIVSGMGFVKPDGSNVDQLAFMVLAIAIGIAWAIVYGNPFRDKSPPNEPKE